MSEPAVPPVEIPPASLPAAAGSAVAAPALPAPSGLPAGSVAAGASRPIASSQLRLWFVVYLLWLGGLTAGALISLQMWRGGASFALPIWAACVGTFYISLANSLVPLPTAWTIMLLASDIVALPGSPLVRAGVVALLCAVATAMANLNEYHLLRWAMGSRIASRVTRTRLMQWGIRWFRASPFAILTAAAFVPIPIDAIRWLAIADGYSRWRYFWAYTIGRWARYFGLAGATVLLAAGLRSIVLVQGAILAVAAVPVVVRTIRRPGREAAR